jgi:hypothetical protein
MCEWNRTHKKPKDRLHFAGFDVQQPQDDGPALIAFLERIGVAEQDPLRTGLKRCDGVAGQGVPTGAVGEEDNAACVAALDAIELKLQREARAIIRSTSKKDLAWAKVRLVGVRAWQGETYYYRRDPARATESRDFGMASVIQAMRALRLPKNAKVALWAHNFHLSEQPLIGARTMGTFLAETLGPTYFVVGLIGYQVEIDWPAVGCGSIGEPEALGVEGKLHQMAEPYLLVDPNVESPVIRPGEPVVALNSWRLIEPRRHFDALLFLDHSPKMNPLRWAPCQ